MVNVSNLHMIQSEKEAEMTEDQAMQRVNELRAQLAELTEGNEAKVEDSKLKKNQKPGKADPNRKYVLLSKSLEKWGRVPQQQADIADILSKNFAVGEPVSEKEVFDAVVGSAGEYKSLYTSTQDPTYLFRYYRGLKNDGKHASFVARNFFRVIG